MLQMTKNSLLLEIPSVVQTINSQLLQNKFTIIVPPRPPVSKNRPTKRAKK